MKMKNKYVRVGLSLIIALVTGFLIYNAASEASNVEYLQVAIVREQINQNETVSEQNVEIRKVPAESVPGTALKEIPGGKRAIHNLYAGQFIIPQMLSDSETVEAQPEHRIYPVPVNLSGTGAIREGDKVDLFWFDETGRQSGEIVSGVTVHSALDSDGNKIVAKEETKIGEKITPAVIELLVTAEQANKLNLAVNNGTFTLGKYNAQSQPVQVPVINQSPGGELLFDETAIENNDKGEER